MSSILDALKKVEEEKRREAEGQDTPIDPNEVADELTGRQAIGVAKPRIGAAVIAMALGLLGIGLVAVAIVGGALLLRMSVFQRPADSVALQTPQAQPASLPEPASPVQEVARPVSNLVSAAEPEPDVAAVNSAPEVGDSAAVTPAVTNPVPPSPPAEEPVESRVQTVSPPAEEVAVPNNTQVPAPESVPISVAETTEVAQPVATPPAPDAMQEPQAETEPYQLAEASPADLPAPTPPPRPVPPRVEEVQVRGTVSTPQDPPAVHTEPAAVVQRPVSRDPDSYPILNNSSAQRLGLPELTINFVSGNSRTSPRASALINMKKVWVEDFIPGTNARLVAVSTRGVVVDVEGERFFVPK